ncbi:deoxyribodipyrimidine photolyase [Bacillus sp. JCM 19046]|nr:deoxyribodipyrimidine photolyase [Bacillus sp. JCM 19045]GAF16120.1 deoxyribodipyrimidine photolyase [Bacillus sp. JCM 19046]
MSVHVIWFRRDLRLNDHSALAEALKEMDKDDQLLFVFHIHPALTDEFTVRHDYFYETLHSFLENAEEKKLPIHFLTGEMEKGFDQLLTSVEQIEAIYFHEDETAFGQKRDQTFEKWAKQKGLKTVKVIDHHLHGSKSIVKDDGTPYKVFSPYYKKWRAEEKPMIHDYDCQQLKKQMLVNVTELKEGKRAYSQLMQQKTGRWKKFAGEASAYEQLESFIENDLATYHVNRDLPEKDATSQLSKYLRTGSLSIRSVYHAALAKADELEQTEGVETFIQELAWRDFYNMIYANYPNSKNEEIQSNYRDINWRKDHDQLKAWKKGVTGFPLVDAAMRQLNETGWMHNRLRMVVASFLTKHLLIDWREGEKYFSEQLIDYDAASNIGGWQWASSTGTDAVPYFRIFNPTRQSERFDKHGRFIRQFVEELQDVPSKFIHSPEKMTTEQKQMYNCSRYPDPIVDHKKARERALETFKNQ